MTDTPRSATPAVLIPFAIVTLICDSGERYLDSYFNPDWLEAQRIDITPWLLRYRCFFEEGRW